MKPIEILEDITHIIAQDYAGAEEVQFPALKDRFLNVCAQLDEHFGFEDEQLFDFVQLYLQATGALGLTFHIDEYAGFHPFSRGFSARSDGQNLYVTATHQEAQVQPGDQITTIAYRPPQEFRALALQQMDAAPALSERDPWEPFLNHAQVIQVQRAGSALERVILQKYPPQSSVTSSSCRKLDTGIVYLDIRSFQDTEPVAALLRANHASLTTCRRLIIDLRQTVGADRDAVLPLLPYVCDRDRTVSEFFQDQEFYTRYSERNCELSKAQLAPYCSAEDPQVSQMAAELLADVEAKRGQGLVLEVEEEDERIQSCRSAEKIILLTDTTCENEAEWFVLGCSRQANVTRLGRPTRGSIDYRNPVTVDYGFGVTFTYPISKTKSCYEGHGYHQTGVPVDLYIPWSRQEIWEDVLLKRAIDL